MTARMIRLKFQADGAISLPVAIANSLESREVTLASRSRRHLLLSTAIEGEGQVSLAGSIGDLQVVEVLSIINMFRKSGTLHFHLEGGSKDLLFEEGELVSASSTFPEEELGEFLLAAGKIERDTLIKVRQGAGIDPSALPVLLLQSGRISQKDLWEASSAQIEAIVYHLIPCQQGDFVFVQRRSAGTMATHVILPTQNLIMEGLRRADERHFFMRTLASAETMPVATGKRSAIAGDEDEDRLFALASSGRLTVRELIARSGLGEFRTLRTLHALVEQQFLAIPDLKSREVPGELAEILTIANGVLGALHEKIHEKNHEYQLEMRRFLRDLPQPFATVLHQGTITAAGTIDAGQIVVNLAPYPLDEQRALLAETMSEVIYMACLAARRELGPNDSQRLIEQAEEIANRINQLKERKNP